MTSVIKGSQFYLYTPRSSFGGTNHACLGLSAEAGTEPDGMEGWVGLGNQNGEWTVGPGRYVLYIAAAGRSKSYTPHWENRCEWLAQSQYRRPYTTTATDETECPGSDKKTNKNISAIDKSHPDGVFVRASEKCSIIANRMSTTCFPTSYRTSLSLTN